MSENMYDAWDNGDRHEIRQRFARREEIIRMAREAGLYTKCEVHSAVPFDQLLERFAALVAAAERERLAQPEQEPVCDKDPQGCWNVRCQLGKVCKNTSPRREWQGLTEEDMPDGEDPMYDDPRFIAGMVWANNKLKERNT